ncbi:MAG: UvrD-helicase domain-containing protein [Terrimicrobiaceae bacterium]
MSFRVSDLNPEQRDAVTHEDGPMLILAGAGTGKTRTITARIAWLVACGADPSKVLAVTFTNKAAREMKERIGGMVDANKAKHITASTFHALCVRILRGDAHRLGYKDNFSIFDDSDTTGLIKKIITRVTSRDEKLDPNLAKNFISKAKNNGWSAPEDDNTVLGAVFRRYAHELRGLNAMDFDDLLIQAVKLLDGHPDVRAKWQARARHLLVDEFQDTNRLQLELVTLLANGDRPDVCVVGDDDQSIYGWRGAEISNILEFERHFPNPKIVRLERNYRSTSSILEAANRLIHHNPRRREKRLSSMLGEGEPVRFLGVPDDRKEASFVVGEIASHKNAERIPWEHFAVLYRMNAQSRLLEEELRKARIPYRLVGGKSFYERREVKDLTAYMTVLINPQDDPALLRIIGTPPRGIGSGTVELALDFSSEKNIPLYEALRHPEHLATCSKKATAAINEFCEEIDSARIRIATPGSDPAAILQEILGNCGYIDDLRRSCKTPEEALNREENAREFIRTLGDFTRQNSTGMRGFLDSIALDREREEDRKEQSAGVTLITLHAAKGLEFPHVFLIGAEDGLLPHERSKTEGTVDEERRLFYVGITRAMRSLVITWCRQRTKFGSPMSCRPSPFLREIDGEGVVEENYESFVNRPMETDDIAAQFAALKARLATGQAG